MTKREQQEKLFRAIGYVGDDLISRADQPVEKQRSNVYWIKWAALAACCVLVIGLASRLPLWSMKSANTAETATMTMETAAAEEAPAEEDAKAEESGVGSRSETASDGIFDEALEQELLGTTLGPVKLGLPAADVRTVLGAPKEKSDELYVCTDKGDFRYIYWRYNLTNDPDYLYDAVLQFADLGGGFVLNEIQTFGTSDWALPSGLKNGCSADDVLAVYPDAELTYSGEGADGSPAGTISLQTGQVRLTFLVEGEKVTSITLGTYYAESGVELETEK